MSGSWIGKIVGNCRIEQKIGEGGCGAVYRGVDLMLDRTVAVKVLHGGLAARRDVAERFRSEAHTLARLSHRNVATLYSFHREEDTYLMVMEFVEGKTFDELIREHGHLSQERAIPLFCQALEGIHHAHQAGVIHRDLKGSNVMRSAQGVVKVMDFGIARALWSPGLTQADHPLGTPEYMSPEQVRAEEIDERADVYSLGVLLFKMLTGRLPFTGDSPYDIMRAQVDQQPPSVRDHVPEIAPALDDVIARALAKDRGERFETADALRCALEEAFGKAEEPTFTSGSLPPVSSWAGPDAHTTPIPLEELAEAGASALMAHQEAPTHVVSSEEPTGEEPTGEESAPRTRLRGIVARLAPDGLAPLGTLPALAGAAIVLVLLAFSLLWEPPTAVEEPRPLLTVVPGPAHRPAAEEPPAPPALATHDGTEVSEGSDARPLEPAPRPTAAPASPRRPAPKPRPRPARPDPAPGEAEGWVIRRQ